MDAVDIAEYGGPRQGERQRLDRRLFVQLRVFTGPEDASSLIAGLEQAAFPAVLYADAQDAWGVGLVTWSEDPEFFTGPLRQFLRQSPFQHLRQRRRFNMFGRTYALGHEPDLEDWLLRHTVRNLLDPEMQWAVWYPLRRQGRFQLLPPEEQTAALREHGRIGHAFGEAGLARDVRLASFGLDANDSDFVIGLLGRELHPLSACVQAMRKTRQTAEFIQAMGPFFTGRVLWRAKK